MTEMSIAEAAAIEPVRVPARVLFLCTGNAARSVMAGLALRRLRPDLSVDTAGTLTVDGLPISWRTRAALDAVSLPWPQHRSRQATRADLDGADIVVAMAPEHVHWVRRQHPAALAHTATLVHLVEGLGSSSYSAGIAGLDLVHHWPDAAEEVVDPGGGDVDAFIACAERVVELVAELAVLL